MSDASPKSNFRVLWVLLAAGAVTLLGGGALFVLNQTSLGGASGHEGPGRVNQVYVVGEAVDIWRNESWLPGEVVRVEGGRYRVEYMRSETLPAEWVGPSRLRQRRP